MQSPLNERSYYHATTQELAQNPALEGSLDVEVCVIGGGFTGVSTALHLAKAGVDVALVEAQEIGHGASGYCGGQASGEPRIDLHALDQLIGREHAERFWALNREALRNLKECIATHNICCDWQPGIVRAAHNSRSARALHDYVRYLEKRLKTAPFSYLDHKKMSEISGSGVFYAGFLDLAGGHLHPLNFLHGLTQSALKLGAKIYESTPVQSFKMANSIEITTPKGHIKARSMVLACNAYLDNLSQKLRAKIIPVTSLMLATKPLDPELMSQINPQRFAFYDTRWFINYWRTSIDNRLLFGGGKKLTGSPPQNIANHLHPMLERIFPQMKDIKTEFTWSRKLAVTRNLLPCIGRFDERLYFAQGYSGHGISLATLAGKLIACKILGRPSDFTFVNNLKVPDFYFGRHLQKTQMTLASLWFHIFDRL